MSNYFDIDNSGNKKIVSVIIFSLLATFALSRLIVYAVLDGLLPHWLFFSVRGVHIHHFTYGVIILAALGLYLLLKRPNTNSTIFKWLVVGYGVGLGLTLDEFGMWIRLKDDYWVRQSYDAIVIVALLLLNIIYFRFFIRALKEIFHLPIRFFKLLIK